MTVYLAGCEYPIEGPVAFGPDDSGSRDCPVTYAATPGGLPVLSGGR